MIAVFFKIYEHFSIHTVRVEGLKEICKESDVEFKQILSYSRTRWLSLLPAVSRNIQLFEPLKAYFLSNESTNDIKLLKCYFENPLSKAYLFFIQDISQIFNMASKQLEYSATSIVETLVIIEDIILRLENRIKYDFISNNVKNILKNIVDSKISGDFIKECKEAQKKGLIYLKKWTKQYDKFKIFEWTLLNQKDKISWANIQKTINFMSENGVNDVNDSMCLNQFSCLENFFENFKKDLDSKSVNQKWQLFFTNFPLEEQNSEFVKIIQYLFAIPCHSANIERIFSLITAQWTDSRNKLKIETIKNLMYIKCNIDLTCMQFFNHIKNNKQLLEMCKHSDKYL